MKRYFWCLGVLAVIFAACTTLPYNDDVGFLVSAQADSTEFPVYINGHLCTDMEGNPGLCSKRIKSTEDISFKFDPQTYAYLLTVNCSSGITPIPPATVPSGQSFSFTIKASDFSQFSRFTCIGEISPQDRTQPLSGKFEVHFTVVDSQYTMRERIFETKVKGKNVLVLGEYARSSWVFDNGAWKQYSKTTIVKIKGDPSKVKAYSESYAMRFNYFNMSDSDSGVK